MNAVSSAQRSPIESEFASEEEELAYDKWFRAKVQHALDNPSKNPCTTDQLRQRLDEIIRVAEEKQARRASDLG